MAKVLKIKEWKQYHNDIIIPLTRARNNLTRIDLNWSDNGIGVFCKNILESTSEKINELLIYISYTGVDVTHLEDEKEISIKYLPEKINKRGDNSEHDNLIVYYNYIVDMGNKTIYLKSQIK